MSKMRSLFMCLTALIIWGGMNAQVPMWMWANGAGGSGNDTCTDVVCDSLGNLYVTGSFQGSAGFGDDIATSQGDYDIFVAKLDTEGDWEWVATAGGFGSDSGIALTLDGEGNLYAAGGFSASAFFGSTTLTSVGNQDVFVAKLDTDGNWLWAKRAGWTGYDIAYEIDTDPQGNVYITGWFTNSGEFGDIFIIGGGNEDMYLAKLDSYGNWLWAINAPGADFGSALGLCLSETGYAYVSGSFMGSVQFGGTNLTSAGSKDIFIAKSDNQGNWLWAKQAGATGEDYGYGIVTDQDSHVLLTGVFQEYAIFGQIPLAGNGSYEGYVAKTDSLGNWLWAQSMGGSGLDCGYGVCLDDAANCFVTGFYSGSAEFGDVTLTSLGGWDVYIAKLSSNGIWNWVKSAGGPNSDCSWDIVQDRNANSYIGGYFQGSFGFDGLSMDGAGGLDAFVAVLSAEVDADDPVNVPALDPVSLSATPNPSRGFCELQAKPASAGSPIVFRQAQLEIYDIKGRKLRSLMTSPGSSGELGAVWDGRDSMGKPCPNGIYLVRLSEHGTTLGEAKLTLLRS